jgi:hypothetical protein
MLIIREAPQIRVTSVWEQPHPCPNCGRTMQLSRSAAHSGGISGYHCYGCGECGLWTTEADDVGYRRRD